MGLFDEEEKELVVGRGGYLFTKNGRAWHRIVCRRIHGFFPVHWHVHHIDGQKRNNEPSNLIALPARMHSTVHQMGELPERHRIERWLLEFLKNGSRQDRKALRAIRIERKLATEKARRLRLKRAPKVDNDKAREMITEFVKENGARKIDGIWHGAMRMKDFKFHPDPNRPPAPARKPKRLRVKSPKPFVPATIRREQINIDE